MLKPLAMAMLMAATQPALAATWSYDFSGNLGDHFDQMWDEPAPSTTIQADGKLTFHTQGTPLAATGELFVFKHFMPSYQQSWTVQMDVMVPASLDNQTPPGSGEFYVAGDLAVFSLDQSGNFFSGMSVDLESNPPNGHQYWAGTLTDDTAGNLNTSDVAGTVWLSFDAATKVMSAYGGAHVQLLSVDTDAPGSDWGMSDGDVFYIAIGFDSVGMSVANGEALTIDNFSATLLPVPEPEAYALMLAGLGLVGLAARRHKSA